MEADRGVKLRCGSRSARGPQERARGDVSSARGGSPRRLGPVPGVPSIRACRVRGDWSRTWVWSDCLSGVLASRNLAVEQTRDRGGAAPRWCGVNQTPIQPRPDRSVAGRPTDTARRWRSALTYTRFRFPGAVESRFRPACERCPPAQTHDHCCAPLPPRRAAILALFTHRGTAARRPTHAAPQEPRAAPPPPSHPPLQQQEQE